MPRWQVEKRNVIIINCVAETRDTWKSSCHSYRHEQVWHFQVEWCDAGM